MVAGFVDSEIKATYQYLVDKFNPGYKNNARTDISKKYEEIEDISEKKSEELGNELGQIYPSYSHLIASFLPLHHPYLLRIQPVQRIHPRIDLLIRLRNLALHLPRRINRSQILGHDLRDGLRILTSIRIEPRKFDRKQPLIDITFTERAGSCALLDAVIHELTEIQILDPELKRIDSDESLFSLAAFEEIPDPKYQPNTVFSDLEFLDLPFDLA